MPMKNILMYSNPIAVKKNIDKWLGYDVPLYISSKEDKKYMIQNPDGKWIHFGQMGYEDFTKHNDPIRRQRYLNRATKIRGLWQYDPYSSNNLAIHGLW
jgi:Family of unknown function (DUF5754)